jgi:DNA-binding transcriptional LysR family regulator
VPAGHALTELETVTLPQVAKYGFLLPNQGRRRELLDYMFEQHKITQRITMELDSSELLKRLILAGLGVGFLPRINVIAEVKQGLLQTIEIEGVDLPRHLALISRQDTTLTRAGNAFFTFATGRARGALMKEAVASSSAAELEEF